MNPLFENLLLPVLGAIAFCVCQFIYRQMTKPRPAAAPMPIRTPPANPGPNMILIDQVMVNMNNAGSIDFRDPAKVLVYAQNEIYDFSGQNATDLRAYFKVPPPAQKAAAAAE